MYVVKRMKTCVRDRLWNLSKNKFLEATRIYILRRLNTNFLKHDPFLISFTYIHIYKLNCPLQSVLEYICLNKDDDEMIVFLIILHCLHLPVVLA